MFKPAIICSDDLRKIPVTENGEILVKADKYCSDLRFKIAPYIVDESERESARFVRETIAKMIGVAHSALPAGYGFVLRCGFRSPLLQARRLQEIADGMMKKNPNLTTEELQIKLDECVAPVDIAPHCTGGAIDIFLCDSSGEYVDIDCEPSSFTDKTYTYSDQISDIARRNREIMIAALSGAGFTNFPGEIWHWSYGEYDWAAYQASPTTIYGPLSVDLGLVNG